MLSFANIESLICVVHVFEFQTWRATSSLGSGLKPLLYMIRHDFNLGLVLCSTSFAHLTPLESLNSTRQPTSLPRLTIASYDQKGAMLPCQSRSRVGPMNPLRLVSQSWDARGIYDPVQDHQVLVEWGLKLGITLILSPIVQHPIPNLNNIIRFGLGPHNFKTRYFWKRRAS